MHLLGAADGPAALPAERRCPKLSCQARCCPERPGLYLPRNPACSEAPPFHPHPNQPFAGQTGALASAFSTALATGGQTGARNAVAAAATAFAQTGNNRAVASALAQVQKNPRTFCGLWCRYSCALQALLCFYAACFPSGTAALLCSSYHAPCRMRCWLPAAELPALLKPRHT